MSDISALEGELLASIAGAPDEAALEAVRVAALGKKGTISELLKTLGTMTPDDRKTHGPLFNGLRDTVGAAIAARKAELGDAALNARLGNEKIDVTLPARPEPQGSIHPVSQVMDEITAIFADLGFAIAEGPDVETDDYNFTRLNIPPDHPARQMHDTFYVAKQADGSRHVLRTHTSPVQVRTMLKQKPPIRVIAPGRTYRFENDATHTPMFHQLEALVIDEKTHLG
ncbi:MAG: phenylalanine--tRNA ligase subunit alpha, partial [Steroidobacteraceae bacterium]